MNVLTQADQGSLEALCECYAEVVELRRDVALNGRFQVVVKADGGTVERLRPAYTALAEADKRLRNWMHDFGLRGCPRRCVCTHAPVLRRRRAWASCTTPS